MKCNLCGKNYKHLGSHLWHTHRMTAKRYKEIYGLDYNYPLIDPNVRKKKQKRFEENKEYYLANLEKHNKKYQFKKGHQRRRFSLQTIHRLNKLNEKLQNQPSITCPLCNIKYKAIYSHLHEKHGLVVVDKDKLWNNK